MHIDRDNLYQNTTVFSGWCRLLPLFACTAVWGLVTVMLGPLLPGLMARWKVGDAQAGTLFAASFMGQFIGAWVATRHLRGSLLAGAGLTIFGVTALVWTGFPSAHLAFFVIGLGISAGLTAGNVLAGLSSPHRARTLAVFNVSWSVGAIICPVLVRLSGSSNPRLFYVVIALMMAVGGLLLATHPRSLSHAAGKTSLGMSDRANTPPVPLFFFAVCMLLYIGNENALGGWLPTFAVRSNSHAVASTIALLYWLSELISRLAMASLPYRVSEVVLYRISLTLLLLTAVFLVLFPNPSVPILIGTAILAGAAIGPVYPLLIAFLLTRFSNHPWIGRLFASASLGGAALPWLTGVVSTHFGGLRAGFVVPATGIFLMLVLSANIIQTPSSGSLQA